MRRKEKHKHTGVPKYGGRGMRQYSTPGDWETRVGEGRDWGRYYSALARC